MRILGIDPGSRFTGFGIVDRQGSKLKVVGHGRIRLPEKEPLPERLARLAQALDTVVAENAPDSAALESLFRGINPKSLIVLAQARGAILATLAGAGVPIAEYSPAEVKSAVTGNGRADKQQVARMVQLLLGLGGENLASDTSDALAVAICFAHRQKLDRLGRRGHSSALAKPL